MSVNKKEKVLSVAKLPALSHEQPIKNNKLKSFYHNSKIMSFFRNKKLLLSALLLSFFIKATPVFAVDKIEGGSITIESLGTIIKKLATQIQVFGIILSFIAMVIFVIQFIIGDDETKQRKKKTILYTLGGVALLILIPSIINLIISTLET